MNKTWQRAKTLRQLALSAAVLALAGLPGRALAGDPTDQLRNTVSVVRGVLRESPRSESNAKGRHEQVRRLIDGRFEFNEIARRSLGAHWKALSPAEQEDFVKTFKGFLQTAYVALIETQAGARIDYVRESRDVDRAEVSTIIVARSGRTLAVDYRLLYVEGSWKVYDVVIENISVVNNYRSQFSRVIAKSSYRELIERMREKQSGAREAATTVRRNLTEESRPLIIAGLIGAAGDKHFLSTPAH